MADDLPKHLKRLVKKNARPPSTRFRLPSNFRFDGLMSQTRRLYIRMNRDLWKDGEEQCDPFCTVIPLSKCGSMAALNSYLGNNNSLLPFPDQRQAALRAISDVRDFDSAILLEHPGYNGSFYAFRDGEPIHASFACSPARDADSNEQPTVVPSVAFRRQLNKSGRFGGGKEYMAELERLLSGHAIPRFGLFAGLTAPVLRFSRFSESFGFWLFGPGHSGKSTVTQLAASAWGCPAVHYEIEDIEFFTRTDLDERLAACNDHPLFLDGADRWFALETDREKLEHVRKLDQAFHHCSEWLSGTLLNNTRTVIWSTAREPVEKLCGNDEAARARLGDRLYAIPVPVDRPGKVFALKKAGDSKATLASLAGELRQFSGANYGLIARRHVAGLLKAAGEDEDSLRALIERYIQTFVKRTGVRENDGQGYLTACRFGLVYAAARLARSYGALPKKLRIRPVVMKVYRAHLTTLPRPPLAERLRSILTDQQTVDLGAGKLPEVPEETREGAMAYVRRRKTGTFIYIPEKVFFKIFPDWDRIKHSDEVTALLQREVEKRKGSTEHKHWTVKQALGANRKTERVYCFRLE